MSKSFSISSNEDIRHLQGALASLVFDSNGDGLTDFLAQEWLPGSGDVSTKILLYQQSKRGKSLKNSDALKGFKAITPTVKAGDMNNDGINDLIIYDLGVILGDDQGYTGIDPIIFSGRKNKKPIKSDILSEAYLTYAPSDSWQADGRVSAKDFALADIDNDGDLDIWVESTGGMNLTNHFLINNGSYFSVDKGRMPLKDIQGENASDFNRYWAAHFEDLNGDGSKDLILGQSRTDDITHINGTSVILQNDRNGFFSLKRRLPRPSFNNGFTVAAEIASGDLNNDGNIDIILSHRRPGNELNSHDANPGTGNYIQVLIQSSQGEFLDYSDEIIGPQDQWSNDDLSNTNFVANIGFFDANNDGWQDILVNYWSNYEILGPTLLVNRNGKKLEPVKPGGIKNYGGEFNFTWDSDQLQQGSLVAMTQVSDSEVFFTDFLFQKTSSVIAIKNIDKYTKKAAAKTTSFDSNSDVLEIDAYSFGVGSYATFAAGKNKKAVKKLARQDFYFLYDQKKGGLYFNENGADKGFGDGGIIAILKGAPDLTSDNLEFI